MPTTEYEYALLSIMSTHRETVVLNGLKGETLENHERREAYLFDHGWRYLRTSEELEVRAHDYYGVAYYRIDEASRTTEVVIAHRGTQLNAGNIQADLQIAEIADTAIAGGAGPDILSEAAFVYTNRLFPSSAFYSHPPAADGTAPFNINGYPVTRITHVGFSLGGFIAGACTALSNSPIMHAVTFDAPGIGGLKFDEKEKAKQIVNYPTTPNFVNTCNPQVGAVRQIAFFKTPDGKKQDQDDVCFVMDATKLGMFSKAREDNYFYSTETSRARRKEQDDRTRVLTNNRIATAELNKTLESHNLERIITHMEENDLVLKSEPVHLWPVARTRFTRQKKSELKCDSDPFYFMDGISSDGLGWQLLEFAGRLAGTAATMFGHPMAVGYLWNLTSTRDKDGHKVGVVGAAHKRSNVVCYSKAEHDAYVADQKKQEGARQRLSEKLQAVQKHIPQLKEAIQLEQRLALLSVLRGSGDRYDRDHLYETEFKLNKLAYKLEQAFESVDPPFTDAPLRVFTELASEFESFLNNSCKQMKGSKDLPLFETCLQLLDDKPVHAAAAMAAPSAAHAAAAQASAAAKVASVGDLPAFEEELHALQAKELSALYAQKRILENRMHGVHSQKESGLYQTVLAKIAAMDVGSSDVANTAAAASAHSTARSTPSQAQLLSHARAAHRPHAARDATHSAASAASSAPRSTSTSHNTQQYRP
jgi:hypothetical protein